MFNFCFMRCCLVAKLLFCTLCTCDLLLVVLYHLCAALVICILVHTDTISAVQLCIITLLLIVVVHLFKPAIAVVFLDLQSYLVMSFTLFC